MNNGTTTVGESGIGFVAYSPMGRGFLTGRIKRVTESDLSELASAMPPGAVIGMRQPEAMMRLSNL